MGATVDADQRRLRIEAAVSLLIEAGGSAVERHHQHDQLDHVVMQDPEGNEFCVV